VSVHFSASTDNWRTPDAFYRALDAEFHFDFDPCPLAEKPKVDGLAIEWGKTNFVNPPYSKLYDWLKKGFSEWQKGKTCVFLVPSRTDTKAWHEFALKATEIRFIKGRLKFGDAKTAAPFPSAIVIFKGVA
jgi:hypothetical protein